LKIVYPPTPGPEGACEAGRVAQCAAEEATGRNERLAACDANQDFTACLKGADSSERLAVALLRKACDGWNMQACVALGESYERGRGVPLDLARALENYLQACGNHERRGCGQLASLFRRDRPMVEAVLRAAMAWHEENCNRGTARSCHRLGLLYRSELGMGPRDGARADALFERACSLGEPLGCYNHGRARARGEGVVRDLRVAFAAYQRACTAGLWVACNNWAEMMLAPEFGSDLAKAMPVLESACNGGDGLACGNLGMLVESTDAVRAVGLFRKSCVQGGQYGCMKLGIAYGRGLGGLAVDRAQEIELMRMTCARGLEIACHRLQMLVPAVK
jgi:TPR repeat protein